MIAVDSLRPDHLGCYGYGRPTSPAIDGLAARGVLFEHALGQASWTTPSFGTVFTSLYPSQHGALTVNDMLSRGVRTLAEMLRERGYATCGIANAPALSSDYGFDRGFDSYDVAEPETRDAEATTGDALKWLDANGRRPFFLFVHYFDVHLPYSPKPPYDRLFDQGYSGSLGNAFDVDAYAGRRDDLLALMRQWSPADWDHVRALYDGEISFTDQAIQAFLKGLDERRLEEKTLIVFVSDHGQEFFEHGAYGHGHSLHGEILRVPLILSLPGRLPGGRRVTEQVRLLDVTPTILDVLGAGQAPEFEGVSLLPLARGEHGEGGVAGSGSAAGSPDAVLPPGAAFAEGVRLGGEKKALTTSGIKVIHDVESGRTSVFDLRLDPGEAQDLGATGRPELREAARDLFKAVFEATETWHLEIAAGGRPHVFDVSITPRRGPHPGQIVIARMADAEGDYRPAGYPAPGARAAVSLDVRGLQTSGTVELLLKAAPARFPVIFDLRMDGEPAHAITYLGDSLARPDTMPFVQTPGKPTARARGEPSERPATPYIAVWLSGKSHGDQAPAALSDRTRRQLRALGYVQ
jgi:arylsulfatase A-like enzyme